MYKIQWLARSCTVTITASTDYFIWKIHITVARIYSNLVYVCPVTCPEFIYFTNRPSREQSSLRLLIHIKQILSMLPRPVHTLIVVYHIDSVVYKVDEVITSYCIRYSSLTYHWIGNVHKLFYGIHYNLRK